MEILPPKMRFDITALHCSREKRMPASVKPLTPAPQMAMRGVVGALANERVRRVVARRLMLSETLLALGFLVLLTFVIRDFRLITWLCSSTTGGTDCPSASIPLLPRVLL